MNRLELLLQAIQPAQNGFQFLTEPGVLGLQGTNQLTLCPKHSLALGVAQAVLGELDFN